MKETCIQPFNSHKSHRERELQSTGRNIGYRSMWQRLVVDHDLVVAKETVRHTLRILDPEGVEDRLRHRL